MAVCFPVGADWSCSYTEEQLAEMRGNPATLATMERSEALAWSTLATLTADRIGTCPITVRPCAATCGAAGTWTVAPVLGGGFAGVLPGHSYLSPYVNTQGAWVNGCGCGSATDCGCSALSEVILPGPVGRINEVWLDGVVLDASTYRVDNGNRLVSLVEGRPWPSCQDLMQDAHGADAFSVTYYQGSPPSDLTFWAAGLLAVEFFKACNNDKACKLPAGVRTVTRQGVTFDIQTDLFEDGRTGIREVDALIARVNPYRLKSRPVIASPDSRKNARQTTWAV